MKLRQQDRRDFLVFGALMAGHMLLAVPPAQAEALPFELPKGVLLVPETKVPEAKRTPQKLYLTPRHGYLLKQKLGDKLMFVDIRTRAEAIYVGFPTIADALVPYMEHPEMLDEWDEGRGTYKWGPNNDFVPELKRRLVERKLDANSPIMLICRSGERTAFAAKLLAQSGFNHVISIIEGFEGDEAPSGPRAGQPVVNGWKNAGLPWSYTLEKSKMYFAR